MALNLEPVTREVIEVRPDIPAFLVGVTEHMESNELATKLEDENAEGLILHRARPLEPVMAG